MANSIAPTNKAGEPHVLTLDTTAVVQVPLSPIPLTDYGPAVLCVQVIGTGSWGSFIPKVRVRGSIYTGANLINYPYVLATSATEVAAGTPVTGTNDILEIDATGKDVFFDYTQDTGSVVLQATWRLG